MRLARQHFIALVAILSLVLVACGSEASPTIQPVTVPPSSSIPITVAPAPPVPTRQANFPRCSPVRFYDQPIGYTTGHPQTHKTSRAHRKSHYGTHS